MAAAEKIHIICPDGNLTVRIVDRQDTILLVSSEVLAKASPVFARRIENLQTGRDPCLASKQIDLAGDGGDAVLTIFNVLHGHISKVPDALPLHLLEQVAECSAKYELADALARWGPKWLSRASSKIERADMPKVSDIISRSGMSLQLLVDEMCASCNSSSMYPGTAAGTIRIFRAVNLLSFQLTRVGGYNFQHMEAMLRAVATLRNASLELYHVSEECGMGHQQAWKGQLKRCSLWPFEVAIQKHTLDSLYRSLGELQIAQPAVGCDCSNFGPGLGPSLQQLVCETVVRWN